MLEAAESLLLIDIINAHGVVIVQTIWATTADRRAGHRLTRSETVASHSALTARLGELTAALFRPDGLVSAGPTPEEEDAPPDALRDAA